MKLSFKEPKYTIFIYTNFDSIQKWENQEITNLFYNKNLPKDNHHESKFYIQILKYFLEENNL